MQQTLPKYLQAVRNAYGTPRIVAESRKALRNIEKLSQNGAPTKALKTAYKQLIETAQTGAEEALNKACWVAMQEKSRYIAVSYTHLDVYKRQQYMCYTLKT